MSIPNCLSDRDILWLEHTKLAIDLFDLTRLNCGRGEVAAEQNHVAVSFGNSGNGEAISEQVHLRITEPRAVNGLGVRVRVRGWKSVSYIAIGYTQNGTYQHVKARHARQDQWFDFCVGHQDIAWGWCNNWEAPEARNIRDVRFYIKGVPGEEAGCDLSDAWIWQEKEYPQDIFGKDAPVPEGVAVNLHEYQQAYFPNYTEQALHYMNEGLCPLDGNVLLEWPVRDALPTKLHLNGTWQYSWHSLHPVIILLLYAADTGEHAPVFAARDLVTQWLSRSYDTPDPNVKYAWYDHGVAERLMALVTLYIWGQRYRFDLRYMVRLREAIYKHAQLLASEVFYVCHQPIRYHNHGWFQDLALMATALAFPHWKSSGLWVDIALSRVEDQFSQLIIHDGDFAVFAENSLGYHLGIEKLVANIGKLAALSGRISSAPKLACALARFSQLMLYPKSLQGIAQGDTFRKANPTNREGVVLPELWTPQIVHLPEAGYVIVKGGDRLLPWLLTMLATNKNSTHKHEDDLSISLWMDGVEWLIDPSFYSHEYSGDIPRYLRSASAHNMLHVKNARYNYLPEPGRTALTKMISNGINHLTVKGINRSCAGFEIKRVLECKQKNRMPIITCSDSFSPLRPTDTEDVSAEGVLTFHVGDGVRIRKASSLGSMVGFELSHPASEKRLVLSFGEPDRVQSIEVESSISGLNFMEQVPTQAIRLRLPHSVECNWCLYVK